MLKWCHWENGERNSKIWSLCTNILMHLMNDSRSLYLNAFITIQQHCSACSQSGYPSHLILENIDPIYTIICHQYCKQYEGGYVSRAYWVGCVSGSSPFALVFTSDLSQRAKKQTLKLFNLLKNPKWLVLPYFSHGKNQGLAMSQTCL